MQACLADSVMVIRSDPIVKPSTACRGRCPRAWCGSKAVRRSRD